MSGFGERRSQSHEPPMSDPLAYFLTWSTYGTWLPGDERGWVERGRGEQLPDPAREEWAESLMTETPCYLDREQRALVERTISEHCAIRRWHLFVVNCRTNHVHVVVHANCHPETVRDQLKAWCTRRLSELQLERGEKARENWWTERGSERYINDEESLEDAVLYVRDAQ
jgi:REP element-mobilizing transposase RayT